MGELSKRRIFISYRRDDEPYFAGRLGDRLNEHSEDFQIFMDIDSIEPGENFTEAIKEAVASSDVLLAVIGERWITMADKRGRRRLDDPDDWVVVEITTALERNVRVIPVLFGGAAMPRQQELPTRLKALATRQAVRFDFETFSSDFDSLLENLERLSASTRGPNGSASDRDVAEDLTGVWEGNEPGGRGRYYLRQVGTELWWAGIGGNFANVLHGQIDGRSVSGWWADVPFGQTANFGHINLRITSARKLDRIGEARNFTATHWERTRHDSPPQPLTESSSWGHDPLRLTGIWTASDGGRYYLRQHGQTLWWLGLSADDAASYASVFHGEVNNDWVAGAWADVPIGAATGSGRLSLAVKRQQGRPAWLNRLESEAGTPGRWDQLTLRS